jgi:hypothetical protein
MYFYVGGLSVGGLSVSGLSVGGLSEYAFLHQPASEQRPPVTYGYIWGREGGRCTQVRL